MLTDETDDHHSDWPFDAVVLGKAHQLKLGTLTATELKAGWVKATYRLDADPTRGSVDWYLVR